MSPALILKLIKYGKLILKNRDKIAKYAKPVAKGVIIGGALAYMYKWMYDLEMKMIKLERDGLNLPEKDGMP